MPPISATIAATESQRDTALRFLDGRINYERGPAVPYGTQQLKLQRMHDLLARLGDPHLGFPIVHVAGTKGKGSTAAMIGAVLSAAGYRTGVYTSPHLECVEERIAIDGQPCSAAELVALVTRLVPEVDAIDAQLPTGNVSETGPTYFEITTAMAMLHFAQRDVAAAIVEVGLGGRLDATNVCRPQVAAITSIGFDHTDQLGNSLQSIAREKAGIVKANVPVVSGAVADGAREVIRDICRKRGARLKELGIDFDFHYNPPHHLEASSSMGTIDFRTLGERGPFDFSRLSLGLPGYHQAVNAGVALAVLYELVGQGFSISEHAIRRGLAGVCCPARVEVFARRPVVVLDSAHNVSSAEALLRVLRESVSAGRRLLIFAATKGKDVRNVLRRLLGHFDTVVFTQYLNNPRAVPAEELAALASDLTGQRYPVCDGPAQAWNAVRPLAGADDLICVTGSFFIAAEMRHLLCSDPTLLSAEAVRCKPA